MHIITTAIIKGGTGKTTTTAALAQAAAADGMKVLCIDLDAQANLSLSLAANVNAPGSLELLEGADPGKVIQTTEQKLDVIPASPNLAALTSKTGSARRLQKALLPIKENYDLIFIDTPPQIGEVTFNALQASTDLITTVYSDNFSLQGLYQITDIAEQIKRTNTELSMIGAIITNYNGRLKINKMMREVIEQRCREMNISFLGTVRGGVAIMEAQALRLPLYEYAPKSNPAQDYLEIYNALKRKWGLNKTNKTNKKCKK